MVISQFVDSQYSHVQILITVLKYKYNYLFKLVSK